MFLELMKPGDKLVLKVPEENRIRAAYRDGIRFGE